MEIDKIDYVLYILMRTDLPSMNPGKAMAQASHASNAFMFNATNEFRSKPEDTPLVIQHAINWSSETDQGFGTVLVLGATMDDIVKVREFDVLNTATDLESGRMNILFEEVIDPTYPYIVNLEIIDLIEGKYHTAEPHELESGDFACFRKEVTCAYLFADKNNEHIQKLVDHLDLHP